MACLNTATRGPLAYVSKRRWLGFQLCSLLVACIMTAVIAPVFIFSLRPQREREQAPGKTMCGPTFRDQGAEYCRILEAAKTSSEVTFATKYRATGRNSMRCFAATRC